MSTFTEKELTDDARKNLTALIERQVRDFFRERWDKFVDDSDGDEGHREMIIDAVNSLTWLNSKTRIANKMTRLRVLVGFDVDLDFGDISDDEIERDDLFVEVGVTPFLAVGVGDGKAKPGRGALICPCGSSLYHQVTADFSRKPVEEEHKNKDNDNDNDEKEQ